MGAFENVRAVYENLGKKEPFWAVLTHDQYKKSVVDKDAFFATGVREVGRQMALIRNSGVELNNERALDFGCGVGRLTNALASYFEEVVGVDVSSTMIASAKELRRDNRCQFMCNPCPDLSVFPDNYFDFIYSDITIQHIPMPASATYLEEFVRVLKDDGLAICLIPDAPYRSPSSPLAVWDRLRRQQLHPWLKRIRGKQPVQIHAIAKRRVEEIVAGANGEILQTEVTPNFLKKKCRHKPLFYWIQKKQAMPLSQAA